MAAGILSNASLMALKGMDCGEWQVIVQTPISSLGMLLVLYLGGVMAGRRIMPFVLVPGASYALASLAMALTNAPLLFLFLGGLGTLFETVSRSAVAAVIRLNYPATQRGAVVGTIRQWFYVTSLVASALAAWALDLAPHAQSTMIKSQMALAGMLSAISFLVFQTIRVQEPKLLPEAAATPVFVQPFSGAWRILREDRRFRLYLVIAFLYCFGDLCYASFIPVLFSRRLQLSYLASLFFISTLPTLLAIVCTGQLGRWLDRINIWKAWTWIRLGWGLDALLLAAASCLAGCPAIWPLIPAVCGRISRGSVSGGSWILWWQVGVNHFAKPGGDTTRYLGMMFFVNGWARLLAPAAGALLLQAHCPLGAIFGAGGLLVLLSSWLSRGQYARECGDERLTTMASFEASQRLPSCEPI
jgi:hypothetical protein